MKMQVLTLAKRHMGEILSAFEFLDFEALQFTLDVLPETKAPLKDKTQPFYAIIETAGSNERHDHEKLQVQETYYLGSMHVCSDSKLVDSFARLAA